MGCSACGLAGAASACPGAANHMDPPPPPLLNSSLSCRVGKGAGALGLWKTTLPVLPRLRH